MEDGTLENVEPLKVDQEVSPETPETLSPESSIEPPAKETKLCKSTKKNGEPCTLLALSDGYCFAHSPAMAEKRKAAYARGGANSAKVVRLQKLMPARMGPVNVMLENILKELYERKIDPRTAQAIAAVSRVLVSSFTSVEVEDRLRKLEEEYETNQ